MRLPFFTVLLNILCQSPASWHGTPTWRSPVPAPAAARQHARRRPWLVLSFPPNPSVSPDTEPRLVSTCPVGGPCLWSSALSGPPVLSRSSGGWILEPGGSVSAADMVTFCFPASRWAPPCSAGSRVGVGHRDDSAVLLRGGTRPCLGPSGWRRGRSVSPDLRVNLCPAGSAGLCRH